MKNRTLLLLGLLMAATFIWDELNVAIVASPFALGAFIVVYCADRWHDTLQTHDQQVTEEVKAFVKEVVLEALSVDLPDKGKVG